MVSMLVWSAVDRGFQHRSDQTKDYDIGICCFSDMPTSSRKFGSLQRPSLVCSKKSKHLQTPAHMVNFDKHLSDRGSHLSPFRIAEMKWRGVLDTTLCDQIYQ
jgi:hypothetical protein